MTITLEQLPYDIDKVYSNPLIELTQSSITEFLTCPQKYVLRYLMHIRRRGISMALLTGTAVHAGLETLIDPKLDIPMDARMPLVRMAIDAEFDKVLDTKPAECIGMEDRMEVGRAQAHALLEAWYIIYADDFKQWTVLHKEYRVRADPAATIDSSIALRGAGMIDGVVLDQSSEVWLLEHKTRGNLATLDVLGLELDAQALWYCILFKYILSEQNDPPIKPKGFLYNAMQKPQHRMNNNGFQDLVNRMVNAMCNTPDKYFSMTPIEVSDETLDRAYDNFERIIRAMDNLAADTVYMNLKACDDYGGCPFRPLCKDKADASKPREVFDKPAIAMFEIVGPHEELNMRTDDAVKWTP